jgi:DNA-binding NarL/FixJ family response regulator
MTTIAFLTNDLLFQSRVASIAKAENVALLADRTAERLTAKISPEAEVRLIIVDLTLDINDLTNCLAAFKEKFPKAFSVAYGPHVHEGKLQRAVEAGFDQVMTRGQFDREMHSLLSSASTIE